MNNIAIGFRTRLEKLRSVFLTAAFILTSLLSCTDEVEELSEKSLAAEQQGAASPEKSSSAARASTNTSISEIPFTATAMIGYCHGENIVLTGMIENRVTTTTDAQGVRHYSRSFTTKGLSASGVNSATVYDVIGGAEMFSIKDAVFINGNLNLSASLAESDIVIHQGTLIFESRTDGSRVIARHTIRKVPGLEAVINKWECQGN